MTIKDFQSKVRNENDALFDALRRINETPNPQRILSLIDDPSFSWDPWAP